MCSGWLLGPAVALAPPRTNTIVAVRLCKHNYRKIARIQICLPASKTCVQVSAASPALFMLCDSKDTAELMGARADIQKLAGDALMYMAVVSLPTVAPVVSLIFAALVYGGAGHARTALWLRGGAAA